jgi:hypothetical protein
MKNTPASTWICKTSRNGTGIAVAYKSLTDSRVAGFSVVNMDPRDYSTLEDLRKNVSVTNKQKGHLTGKTFGQQAWDIYSNAKVGDRIFLECPDADKKQKSGKHSTFIVAAGVVTGPFSYSPKKWNITGTLSTGVDWQWFGKKLIEYGHQQFCFVGIKPTSPSNKKLLERLDEIWITRPSSEAIPTSSGIKSADSKKYLQFDPEWTEGDPKMRQHLTIERCSKAALTAKNLAREKSGYISCDSCGTIPVKSYGHELIDAHHIIPLADTKGMARVPSADDFAMLCPTCHRAVHKEIKAGSKGKEAIAKVKAKLR